MLFQVTRTSCYGTEDKPYEECKEISLPNVQLQPAFDTPEAFDEWQKIHHPERLPWLSEGTNHRLIDGHIARDFGEKEAWGN